MLNDDSTSAPRAIDPDAEFQPIIVCGLTNIGNTCYFNAGLQCLANTPQFVTALRFCGLRTGRERERHIALRRSNTGSRTLISATTQTINAMDFGEEPRVSPVGMVKALMQLHQQFEGFGQQDSPEMVHALLQTIDDETSLTMETRTLVERSATEFAAPKCRSAAEEVQLLRFMQAVNDENERKEQEARRKAGKPFDVNAFRPPHLTRSCTNDPFLGYALSEVKCGSCSAVSRVVDSFTTLTVEIPNAKQRKAYRDQHPPHPAARESVAPPKKAVSWNPISAICRGIAAFFSFLCCCCGGGAELGPLTLKECLDVHFNTEVLRGANQYRCEVCGGRGVASKSTTLLRAPEVLVVHLKRFEHGYYWNTKKHDHVDFPLDFDHMTPDELAKVRATAPDGGILDMASYLVGAKSAAEDSSPVTAAMPRGSSGVTTYSLTSVVNHHGTFGGGHYTAFVRKGTHGWVLANDGAISRVPRNEVADSQGYLLFYQKASVDPVAPELAALRGRARSYLLGLVELPENAGTGRELERGDEICYISKLWLHKCATYCEPGVLLNRMCYCGPTKAEICLGPDGVDEHVIPPRNGARHFHCPAEWFYVPVRRRDFDAFVAHFGGGPAVSHADFQAMLRKEQLWLTALLERAAPPI